MPLFPFLDNRNVQVSRLNDAVDNATRIRHQTADQIRNNTTVFLSSPDLVLSLKANAVYAYDALYMYDTSQAANINIRLGLPLGTTVRTAVWRSGGGAVDAAILHDMTTSVTVPAAAVGIGTVMSCRPCGVIFSGAAGDLVVQFAQITADPVNTRLKLGSWIRLSRVA